MSDQDKRTMYELVQNVLEAGGASNLSGVVHSFSRDIRRVRELLEEAGYHSTNMVNRHPVCVLCACCGRRSSPTSLLQRMLRSSPLVTVGVSM